MNLQKEGIVYTPEKIANYITKITIEKFLLEKINDKFATKRLNLNILFEKYLQKDKNREVDVRYLLLEVIKSNLNIFLKF